MSVALLALPTPPFSAAKALPEARVRGYRIAVERVLQSENLVLAFGEGLTGRASYTLEIAVHPPGRDGVAAIEGLGSRVTAATPAGERLELSASPVEDAAAHQTGIWRAAVSVPELGPEVTALTRMEGTLLLDPHARGVRVELPAAAGSSVQSGGFSVRVRQAQFAGKTFTLVLEMNRPSGTRLVSPDPAAPAGVVALTRAGTAVPAENYSAQVARRGGADTLVHRLTYGDLAEPPRRLRIAAVLRSPAVAVLPFVLPPLELPDEVEAARSPLSGLPGPLGPDHSLFESGGGYLVGATGASGGSALFGLSRWDGTRFLAWRWIECGPDGEGTIHLGPLRPGRYRVLRHWMPPPRPGGRAVRPAAVEVRVPPGSRVPLPLPAGAGP